MLPSLQSFLVGQDGEKTVEDEGKDEEEREMVNKPGAGCVCDT